jgi:hypothetical protein
MPPIGAAVVVLLRNVESAAVELQQPAVQVDSSGAAMVRVYAAYLSSLIQLLQRFVANLCELFAIGRMFRSRLPGCRAALPSPRHYRRAGGPPRRNRESVLILLLGLIATVPKLGKKAS